MKNNIISTILLGAILLFVMGVQSSVESLKSTNLGRAFGNTEAITLNSPIEGTVNIGPTTTTALTIPAGVSYNKIFNTHSTNPVYIGFAGTAASGTGVMIAPLGSYPEDGAKILLPAGPVTAINPTATTTISYIYE